MLRKINLPTYKKFLPVLKINLISMQQILSSSSLWIRSLPFSNTLFIRCTLIYIRVHYENDLFEQTSSAFSTELGARKTMDIISSLFTAEGGLDFYPNDEKTRLFICARRLSINGLYYIKKTPYLNRGLMSRTWGSFAQTPVRSFFQ